ncbi:epithelial membrane protein 1 [Grus japonensis]|uniref:Epithelial membrane protein 1 n=1 Tax=Grus japonensis TaxID=30415 RepID=A0ABC9VU10_GRUJA
MQMAAPSARCQDRPQPTRALCISDNTYKGPKMLVLLAGIFVVHIATVIMLFVSTIANVWMVGSSSLGTVSSGLWLLCNKTCEQLPVSSRDEASLKAVQAFMILSIIFSVIALVMFIVQLFTLEKGKRFYITGAIMLVCSQDTVGFLGCKCTLSAHVELLINQHLPSPSPQAALNPFSTQPIVVLGIALTHVQDLALGLVELHEVSTDSPLKPVKVPLDGILSVQRVDHTTQLGVISKLAEGALNPAVHVANKDVKRCRSQYRPLRNATRH